MFIKILSTLRHDGERLKPGTIVEMDTKQAAILIADGIAEKTTKPVPGKEPAKSTKPGKTEKAATDSSGSQSTSNDKEPADGDNAEGDEAGKDDSADTE